MQNFDDGNFEKSWFGKFWLVKIDECQCVHFIFILIVMLSVRTCLFISYTYVHNYISVATYIARNYKCWYICTCICTCIAIYINHTFLEWPQDICEHGEGHVISHHSVCIIVSHDQTTFFCFNMGWSSKAV